MLSSRSSAWISVAVLAALSSGCFLNSSAYDAAGAGAASSTKSGGSGGGSSGKGGGPGGGGSGGVGGGSGGSGGSTTTTTTTTTTMPECGSSSGCPKAQDECHESQCVSGACVMMPSTDGKPCGSIMGLCQAQPSCQSGVCQPQQLPSGTKCGSPAGTCWGDPTCNGDVCQPNPLPDSTPLFDDKDGDCQRPVCDGQGNINHLADDTDIPKSNDCVDRTCVGGAVMSTPKNDGQQTGKCGAVFKCCSGHCCDVVTCQGCIY